MKRFAAALAEERAKVVAAGILIREEFERWDAVRDSMDSMEGIPDWWE